MGEYLYNVGMATAVAILVASFGGMFFTFAYWAEVGHPRRCIGIATALTVVFVLTFAYLVTFG